MSAAIEDADRTLQALTEQAVADREQRPLLAAGGLVPAVQLAQQVAEQLLAYDLGYQFAVDDGEETRYYQLRRLSWRMGLRRSRAVILCREHAAALIPHPELLWNPRDPGAMWDSDNPPLAKVWGIETGSVGPLRLIDWALGEGTRLAGAATLAQWALDAQPLLDSILDRERAATEHLRAGSAAAESALQRLAI